MRERLTLFGVHAALSLLRNQPGCVERVMLARGDGDRQAEAVAAAAAAAGVGVSESTRRALDEACGGAAHQGVVLHCRRLPELEDAGLAQLLDALDGACLLLLLDGVQDPHNLGACLRTADAAGVDAVVAPRHGAAGLGPTVSKVAAGAAEHLPFAAVANLGKVLDWLGSYGIRRIGTSDRADASLWEADLAGPVALVMGREHTGLSKGIASRCDALVSLPMRGAVSSLNVSVATGICLYEIVRRRGPAD